VRDDRRRGVVVDVVDALGPLGRAPQIHVVI
jgi:hypothetical protein